MILITEEKLKKQTSEGLDTSRISKLNEEINLLYVAATRCRNSLVIPESLMPENFLTSNQGYKRGRKERNTTRGLFRNRKAYIVSQVRESCIDASGLGLPRDDELTSMFYEASICAIWLNISAVPKALPS